MAARDRSRSEPRLKVAVVTLGSAGDLHPFLAVARALTERGHRVSLLSQAPHRAAVEAEGVRFEAIADEAAHERTLNHPLLWHPVDGFGVLWRHLAVPAIGPTLAVLEQLREEGGDGPLVVFASPLAAGARLAREKWPDDIRLLSGYTAPMGLRSTDDPMLLGSWPVPRWWPRAIRQLLWLALDRWKLEPMARPKLKAWTDRLGLPAPSASLFGDWLHGPEGGITLYPGWFASVPDIWAARGVAPTDFALFQGSAGAEPTDRRLTAFLADSRPYVVVFPGSAANASGSWADRLPAACRPLGWRVLRLGLGAPLGEVEPPDPQDLWLGQASLPAVLPNAMAFVHHGGIGSLAQGLAAEAPQLVLPSAYDQFENGIRLKHLGLGDWLPPARADARSIETALRKLVDRRDTPLQRDLRLSRPGAPNSGVIAACERIEQLNH